MPADDATDFCVVVNAAGQYSILDSGLSCPPGWTGADFAGSRADCLEWIDRVWTDLKPGGTRDAEVAS